jgi:hypothetical protein
MHVRQEARQQGSVKDHDHVRAFIHTAMSRKVELLDD